MSNDFERGAIAMREFLADIHIKAAQQMRREAAAHRDLQGFFSRLMGINPDAVACENSADVSMRQAHLIRMMPIPKDEEAAP